MLKLKDFSLSFSDNDRYALESINLEVKQGEIQGLIGESGGGKSLIALGLMGLLPRTARVSGSVEFNGKTFSGTTQRQLAGRDVALVPQSIEWFDPLRSIISQVQRAARRAGISRWSARQVAEQALWRFQLPEPAWLQRPHELSGGMARRALLAAATVASPSFLIADEPTTGLDPQTVIHTLRMLRKLADEGCGVLLISHDLPATLKVADRISVLKQGRCIDQFDCQAGLLVDQRHPYTAALWQALPEHGLEVVSPC